MATTIRRDAEGLLGMVRLVPSADTSLAAHILGTISELAQLRESIFAALGPPPRRHLSRQVGLELPARFDFTSWAPKYGVKFYSARLRAHAAEALRLLGDVEGMTARARGDLLRLARDLPVVFADWDTELCRWGEPGRPLPWALAPTPRGPHASAESAYFASRAGGRVRAKDRAESSTRDVATARWLRGLADDRKV